MLRTIKQSISNLITSQKFLHQYQYNRIDNFKAMLSSIAKSENGTKIECYLDCIAILHGTKKIIEERTWTAKINELDG